MKRAALALALGACVSRAPLPRPRTPLVATEDAPFRERRPPLGEPPSFEAPVLEEATLANGLRLIVARRAGAALTQFAFVNRRAGDEAPDVPPGLAHLTVRVLADALARPTHPGVAPLELRSWTSHEGVGLHGPMLPTELPGALAALREALGAAATADRARFLAVRATVADGLHHRAGAGAVFEQILDAAIYSDPLHARPAQGLSSQVCGFGQGDVTSFLRARYTPGASALVVVGRAPLAEVRLAAEAALGDWSGVPQPERPTTPPALRRGGSRLFVLERRRVEQVAFSVTAPLRVRDERARVALALFDTMLGATPGSRLFRALRIDRGTSYSVTSALSTSLDATRLTVRGAVPEERAAESLRVVLTELAAFGRTEAAPWEFERARALLRQRLREGDGADDDTALASSLAESFLTGEPAGLRVTRSQEILAALTPADVRRVVAESLAPSLTRAVVFGNSYALGDQLSELGLGSPSYLHREFDEGSVCGAR